MNKQATWFSILAILTFASCSQKMHRNHQGADEFRVDHQKNLVLVQYYRWFQVFERELTPTRMDNHLELLSDNILITTYTGPLRGKDGMVGFANHVKDWKNSHHIENVMVREGKADTLLLEADILYQNILPDTKRNSYRLHYSTKLTPVLGELPQFTHVTLLPTETVANPTFEDAYNENRSKSLVYYWLLLMDNSTVNKPKFGELMVPAFRFGMDTEANKDDKQFFSWLRDAKKKVIGTNHIPKNFIVSNTKDGKIQVSFDVQQKSIDINEVKFLAEFHHDWILENNLDERFARVREMKITQTKPIEKVVSF